MVDGLRDGWAFWTGPARRWPEGDSERKCRGRRAATERGRSFKRDDELGWTGGTRLTVKKRFARAKKDIRCKYGRN